MSINFPNSPTLNQQFTSGGTTWIWDGTKWNLYLGENIVTTADLSSALSSYALNVSPTITGNPNISGYQRSIPYSASATSSPNVGDYYVNSTDNVLYVYTGLTDGWVSLGSTPDSDQVIIANRMFG